MNYVLITGANKGIGLSCVETLLQKSDYNVLLGSRDLKRGEDAAAKIQGLDAAFAGRVTPVQLDVASDESVNQAAQTVKALLDSNKDELLGVVNNAGILWNDAGISAALQTNLFGMKRVNDAFIPMLSKEDGRVVNIASASGPMFVADCSASRQKFFTNPAVTWEDIEGLIAEVLAAEKAGTLNKLGLGDWDGDVEEQTYGFSKALVNCYTQHLAASFSPRVRAITPGYIATDMTTPWAEEAGQTPAEMGMKAPADGARTVVTALLDDRPGNGWYYGSDGLRSPLDRYRAPGSAPYNGE